MNWFENLKSNLFTSCHCHREKKNDNVKCHRCSNTKITQTMNQNLLIIFIIFTVIKMKNESIIFDFKNDDNETTDHDWKLSYGQLCTTAIKNQQKSSFFCKMVLDQAKIVNTDTLNLYIHICKRMNIEEVVKIPKELAALIKDDHYYCYWQLRTIEEFLLPDKKNERQNNNNDVYDHGGDQFKKKILKKQKKKFFRQ